MLYCLIICGFLYQRSRIKPDIFTKERIPIVKICYLLHKCRTSSIAMCGYCYMLSYTIEFNRIKSKHFMQSRIEINYFEYKHECPNICVRCSFDVQSLSVCQLQQACFFTAEFVAPSSFLFLIQFLIMYTYFIFVFTLYVKRVQKM